MLCIDPAFDGMAGEGDIFLREGQFFAGRDAYLFAHQIDPGDFLGDRVFHLQTGIHLDEEELAILIKEFHCADAKISHLSRRFGGNSANVCALIC